MLPRTSRRLLLIAAVLLTYAACLTTKPPVVVPHPTQPFYSVACVVTSAEDSTALSGMQCVSGEHAVTTNGDGYGVLDLPTCTTADCGWMTASGPDRAAVTIRFQNDHNQDLHFSLASTAPPLPRLRARGQHLETENGDRFTVIEASAFTLYQQYLDGADVTSVLAQLRDLGFNTIRVFGMYNNPSDPNVFGRGGIGHFVPEEYGSRYFEQLPAFYKLAGRYGLYVEFTAFADATVALPGVDAQLAHWNQLVGTLQPVPNVLLEAVNEADQVINRLDALSQLPRPQGVLASHGSNGSQAWPVEPKWDYATFHTNGAPEEQRKVGHNAMEIWTGATVTNETSRDTLPQPFDSAAGAALLAAGACYHTSFGKYGRLIEGPAVDGARAFVNGAKSVNLACQDGPYIHRQDLESPSVLRAYQRGADPACVVLIHK